ncbi:hypothetical protein CTEN210_12186 [Chaetoceros tenuissimus]|uniref:Uncharacterized protein n=1 Tax=Chaetoceros tenuissimus TaxID=426638 RepID=A0AAD3D2V2_9STRA|nr:hypothetical protein CTEN210_12186 [Chaetoceros tenuissimus]
MLAARCEAFQLHPLRSTTARQLVPLQSQETRFTSSSIYRNKSTKLYDAKPDRPKFMDESESRGNILLGFALAVCIWAFSIPPELRREHFCFTDKCVENRSYCYDCVTFGEWYGQVKEYYANGGGVHFDFSIEKKD